MSALETHEARVGEPGTALVKRPSFWVLAVVAVALIAWIVSMATQEGGMTPLEVGYVGCLVSVLLLFCGIPVGIVLISCGFVGFAVMNGIEGALGLMKTVPYTTANTYTLSVIPLFTLMGQLAFASGISEDLFVAANKWFGHLPGGLAMATITAGAGFGAMCGSSAAAVATFGTVALPEMRRLKYDPGYAAAAVVCCGTLAILIPPSGAFIIFGVITEQSIGKLFIAGIVPGLFLAAMYLVGIYITARRNPELAPSAERYSWRERIFALRYSWPMIVLFGFVMFGIWGGIFTPSEAGALGAFGATCFLIFRRKCTLKDVKPALTGTVNTTGMIFIILIGAFIFGYFLTVTGLPRALAAYLAEVPVPPIAIVVAISFLYFVLGFFLDMLSIVVVTVPLFFPVIVQLGFDPIWWGVLVVVALEQGQITPPMGINLFILCGMAKDIRMEWVIRHIWPYIACLFIFMFVMIVFPDLALWLPNMMKY